MSYFPNKLQKKKILQMLVYDLQFPNNPRKPFGTSNNNSLMKYCTTFHNSLLSQSLKSYVLNDLDFKMMNLFLHI